VSRIVAATNASTAATSRRTAFPALRWGSLAVSTWRYHQRSDIVPPKYILLASETRMNSAVCLGAWTASFVVVMHFSRLQLDPSTDQRFGWNTPRDGRVR